MARSRFPFLRILFRLFAVLIVLVLLAPVAGWLLVRASLPTLDGTRSVAGLTDKVTVERDADGTPTVHARSREDLACALGFLHAQDRFFEMDLLRRQGAGELAELFGPLAVATDRQSRQHGFRRRVAAVLQTLTPDEARQIDAYVAGVNAGLDALGARPWEYLALRATPRRWTREDCVLVMDAMAITLETDGTDERSVAAIAQTYGEEALNFLRPVVTERSAALDGSTAPAPPIPDAAHLTPRPFAPGEGAPVPFLAAADSAAPDQMPGSNSFVLSGTRTAGGAALVANDPHLHLAVPNLWYRASLALPDMTATGATLPGVPGVILGSNGKIAWGFTNGYADTCDLVVIEIDPADPGRYRVPDGNGWEPFEIVRESIGVHGGAPETCEFMVTRWGPLITRPGKGGPVYAQHWTECEPGGINFGVSEVSAARNIDEAIAVAHGSGLHPQNFLVGDREGNVAWTLIGHVPRRVGFDGQTPQSWADGTRHWDGFLPPEQVPVIRNPTGGQLWSANNRAVGGEMLALLGDGGYDGIAFRAGQIRDRLTALTGRAAKPADLLAVQLDDEALYLTRWRELLMQTLSDAAVENQPDLEELREIVRSWDGHASVNAAGYRLLREFRRVVTTMVINPILEPVQKRDPVARLGANLEQPLWSILTARPAHLLPSSAASWDDLLLRAAHMTARLGEHEQPDALPLSECTWGRYNVLAMKHPLSGALPARFARWLDMPAQELPGDANMPRVQMPAFGASMRMVVSPGHEDEGIWEQPGGASGHPFSRFYRAGHQNWTDGKPSPFLPGEAKYRLELKP